MPPMHKALSLNPSPEEGRELSRARQCVPVTVRGTVVCACHSSFSERNFQVGLRSRETLSQQTKIQVSQTYCNLVCTVFEKAAPSEWGAGGGADVPGVSPW